jgi:hypothetical protein
MATVARRKTMIDLLWPVISTAGTGVLKAWRDKIRKRTPAALWPILNALIAAVIAGVASSGSPDEVMTTIVSAVVAAFGLNKALDVCKGKTATIKPEEKKRLRCSEKIKRWVK